MRIGIIGCGHIGSGLAGLFSQGHQVSCFDHKPKVLEGLQQTIGAIPANSVKELASSSDLLLIAVKPQDLTDLAAELAPHLTSRHILLSVVAGYTCAMLRQLFPKATSAYLMPNLGFRFAKGVMALEQDPTLSAQLKAQLEELLRPAGLVVWIPTESMHAVTALSGSGIAFVLLVIEAMAEGGIAVGLTANQALELAIHTVGGAVALAEKSQMSLAQLRSQITGPAGPTIEGIRVLERQGARSALIEAVVAACQRAKEMGKNK